MSEGDKRPPRPPAGLGAAGKRLWRNVLADYELGPHERELLVVACTLSDTLARLAAEMSAAELAIGRARSARAERECRARAARAAREYRSSALVLGRMLAQLRLPDPDDGDGRGAAAPGAARGFYVVGSKRVFQQ